MAEVADELAFGMGDVATDSLTITVADGYRNIVTASYSTSHDIDPDFRYPGTPAAQDPGYTYKVTTDPQIADSPTYVQTGQVFGVHLDSVVWDPKTAGYYNNDMSGGWNSVATADQLDVYGAHTRPETGFYHYHSVTEQWLSDSSVHSALVGWAADGFPVYLRYGYTDPTDPARGVTNLQSSYQLKSGSRPSGSSDPGGTYDGTYVADYEYVEGLGDLDECNGRECVTPEFPDGTYAYFLTDAWPWVPTYLRGTPDDTFAPGFGGGSGLPPRADAAPRRRPPDPPAPVRRRRGRRRRAAVRSAGQVGDRSPAGPDELVRGQGEHVVGGAGRGPHLVEGEQVAVHEHRQGRGMAERRHAADGVAGGGPHLGGVGPLGVVGARRRRRGPSRRGGRRR